MLNTIDGNAAGQRLDNYLFSIAKHIPKTRIYRALRTGEIRVNKKRIDVFYRLAKGDQLRLPPWWDFGADTALIPKPRYDVKAWVIFEDESAIVLNKPVGLSVHSGSQETFGVIDYWKAHAPEAQSHILVHRLDKTTSGCLLLAKNRIFAQHLQKQWVARTVKKVYWALVEGQWPAALEWIKMPLNRSKSDVGGGAAFVDEQWGQEALTQCVVLRRYADKTLMAVTPYSGRYHQIRVHLAYVGHPICFDVKYGAQEAKPALPLCLHAHSLEWNSPLTGETIRVEAPLNQYFSKIIQDLNVSN